jgi:hypothetical protein
VILALFRFDFEIMDFEQHQVLAVSLGHSFLSQFAYQLGLIHVDAFQEWACSSQY